MTGLQELKAFVFALVLAATLTACGAGSEKWKEEVLLHDGSKIIVTRTQKHGGSHEFLTQSPPISEHTMSFTIPATKELVTWKSEYSEDIGRTNFNLLTLDIVNGTPYIVADPNLCLSYNKWGRPNPPYIFFKYVNQQWEQIPLREFPVEVTQINTLFITYGGGDVNRAIQSGFVSAETVKQLNWPPRSDREPKYKSILKEPIEKVGCPDWSLSGPKAPTPMAPLNN